ASLGITMVDGMPSCAAAAATPCAWLPEEKATTPDGRSFSGIWLVVLKAPRNLNDPVRCSISGFTRMRPPAILLSAGDSTSGVRTAWPLMRCAAAWMSASVTAGSEVAEEVMQGSLYFGFFQGRRMADIAYGHADQVGLFFRHAVESGGGDHVGPGAAERQHR